LVRKKLVKKKRKEGGRGKGAQTVHKGVLPKKGGGPWKFCPKRSQWGRDRKRKPGPSQEWGGRPRKRKW